MFEGFYQYLFAKIFNLSILGLLSKIIKRAMREKEKLKYLKHPYSDYFLKRIKFQ